MPMPLSKLLPPTSEPRLVETQLAGQLTVKGPLDQPESKLTLLADQVLLGGRPTGTFKLGLDSSPSATRLDASFLSRDAGSLTVQGEITGGLGLSAFEQGAAALRERPLRLTADTAGFDLALFDGLSPAVRDLAGRLDLHVSAEGTVGAPALKGAVRVTEARAALPGLGLFESVGLNLRVDGPNVVLDDLSGRSGAGHFALNARSGPAPEGGFTGEAHAHVQNLPLVQNYQTRGFLTLQADAPVITWKERRLEVPKLRLSQGFLKVPERPQRSVQSLDPHPDVVLAGQDGREKAPKPLDWKATVDVEIPDDFRIDAPLGNVLVLGADLTARLDESLNTDGKGPFDLSGAVRLPRGNLQILQARFDIDPRSRLTLYPRQWANPTVDVTARHESKGVEVTATITGTMQEMVRNFAAKPEMDEAEILYFIATGQRQQRAQSDPFSVSRETLDDTLVGLVGSIGSSFAKSFLNRYIGGAADLDVLSLDTRGNAKVGTYLWNGRLYLGAQVRPNANTLVGENTAELDAEYRINDRTYGRLRVGDQSRSGLEILFQDSVPAASQKKAEKRR
jgi:autotransporter translocation and assembly factor TamB